MKQPNQMSRTAVLVEGALMIALAFALSSVYRFRMPLGGSVTVFSTLPIILFSLRHPIGPAFAAAALYGAAQLFQGADNLAYMHTAVGVALCVLLDYMLPYACLALTGPIARRFSRRAVGLSAGILATGAVRFACSFFAGLLIWPPSDGTPAALHSLVYNATWCGPDVAIVLAAALALSRVPALGIIEVDKKRAESTAD